MTNVIGYKEDPHERQTIWNCLISLREVLKIDQYNPKNKEAFYKEKRLYDKFLNSYIR